MREIVVEGADGTSFNSPQTIASAMYAPIAFDPFGFLRLDAKAKVETLKALVPGFDFAANVAARKKAFTSRTDVGRDLERAKARAVMPEADKVEAVDVGVLAGNLAALIRENAAIDERGRRRAEAREDLNQRRDAIELAEAKLATMKREADELEAKLNAAEAFETFLQTKYVGQKRFSLEGAESVIPMMDAVIDQAAEHGLDEVVIGMPHRGRLNVLANIVGKPYSQIFSEFEGNLNPSQAHGSGDVKYHQFFDVDGKLLLADIGHYGSEQFTMDLIQRRLGEVFPTFAVRLTEIVTDPIYHF